MTMVSKNIAVFLACISIVAALHVQNAEAHSASPEASSSSLPKATYVDCFKNCESECQSKGNGYTLCEMKCDTECAAKEAAAKLNAAVGN